jgi:hypothetical protein
MDQKYVLPRMALAADELLECVEIALDLFETGFVDFAKYGFLCDSDIAKKYRAAIAKAKGKVNNG